MASFFPVNRLDSGYHLAIAADPLRKCQIFRVFCCTSRQYNDFKAGLLFKGYRRMQRLFSKLIIKKWQKRVSPQVNEPMSANVEHATRYQDTLSQLTRHTRDSKLLMLYRAMDVAG
jgi:hypothetical protein